MSLKTQLQAAIDYCNTKLTAKGAQTASTVYDIGDKIETIQTGGGGTDYLALYIANASCAMYDDNGAVTGATTTSALAGWSNLQSVRLRAATTISIGTFDGCSSLASAVFDSITRIRTNAFRNCSSLNVVVLKYNGVVTLDVTAAFNGTPMSTTATGTKGTFYVPQAQISAYQSNANWSALHADFIAIEGSVYE